MPDGKRKSITPAIIATIADNQNRERTPPSAAIIGPMINEESFNQMQDVLQNCKNMGAVVTGGDKVNIDEVMSNIRIANFDPELFKQYESEIIQQFNLKTGKNIVMSEKKWWRKLLTKTQA